jgi:hypothetical protein
MNRKFYLLLVLVLISSLALAKQSYTGTWQTNWGKVVLEQRGGRVTGKYIGSFNGTIEGKVVEGKLMFKWFQSNGEWGRGYFVLSKDGSKITGRWGGGESDSAGGPWTGKRI